MKRADEFVTVLDDKGKTHTFRAIDQFSYADVTYLVAKPLQDRTLDGKGIFLRVDAAGDEVVYRYLSDDQEWHRVFAYAQEASIIWEGEVTRGSLGLGLKRSFWKWLLLLCEKAGYAIFLFAFLCVYTTPAKYLWLLLIETPLLLFGMFALVVWQRKLLRRLKKR